MVAKTCLWVGQGTAKAWHTCIRPSDEPDSEYDLPTRTTSCGSLTSIQLARPPPDKMSVWATHKFSLGYHWADVLDEGEEGLSLAWLCLMCAPLIFILIPHICLRYTADGAGFFYTTPQPETPTVLYQYTLHARFVPPAPAPDGVFDGAVASERSRFQAKSTRSWPHRSPTRWLRCESVGRGLGTQPRPSLVSTMEGAKQTRKLYTALKVPRHALSIPLLTLQLML
jgi:hypothetical protein